MAADTPWWTWAAPLAALIMGIVGEVALHGAVPIWFFFLALPFLFVAVFAAVHHAETVAHRIGQPFGSIVLAMSVTLIEVALIVSVLLTAPGGESAVARDTVFAAIMIVLNGILGLCLLVGGYRFHRQGFQPQGATAALSVLGTLAVLALVLPNYTLAQPGPVYAPAQLVFVAVVSLSLYALFLYIQTVRHKEDFIDASGEEAPQLPVERRTFLLGLALLPVSLLAVVLLAELLSVNVETAVEQAGLPEALVGVAIALIVLLPEGVASVRAAKLNRLQDSLNLALGSALASLCLTIPTVAVISLILDQTLILGLDAEHIVLLVLTLFMATLSLATGRTTILQGGVHAVILAAFLIISAVP